MKCSGWMPAGQSRPSYGPKRAISAGGAFLQRIESLTAIAGRS